MPPKRAGASFPCKRNGWRANLDDVGHYPGQRTRAEAHKAMWAFEDDARNAGHTPCHEAPLRVAFRRRRPEVFTPFRSAPARSAPEPFEASGSGPGMTAPCGSRVARAPGQRPSRKSSRIWPKIRSATVICTLHRWHRRRRRTGFVFDVGTWNDQTRCHAVRSRHDA